MEEFFRGLGGLIVEADLCSGGSSALLVVPLMLHHIHLHVWRKRLQRRCLLFGAPLPAGVTLCLALFLKEVSLLDMVDIELVDSLSLDQRSDLALLKRLKLLLLLLLFAGRVVAR